MGMKHVCKNIDGCKKAPVSAPAAPSAPASPAAKAVAVPAVGDDGELLAVISAAIAAMCGSAARVVSFALQKPLRDPAGNLLAGSRTLKVFRTNNKLLHNI